MEITHDKLAGIWKIETKLPFPLTVQTVGKRLKSFISGTDRPLYPRALTPLTRREFNACNHYRVKPGHSIALPKQDDAFSIMLKFYKHITEADRITDEAELEEAYQFHANSLMLNGWKHGLTCTIGNSSRNALVIPCNVLWQPMAAVESKDGAIHLLFHPTFWAKLRHGFKLKPYTVTLLHEQAETAAPPQPHSAAA